jgi:hypothetical protein
MADYYPLIARAVAGLDKNTGDGRRALYERARTALVAQLRSVDPPLSENDVTRERLALEESIRKVEAEAARRNYVDPAQAAATNRVRAPAFPRWDPPAPTAPPEDESEPFHPAPARVNGDASRPMAARSLRPPPSTTLPPAALSPFPSDGERLANGERHANHVFDEPLASEQAIPAQARANTVRQRPAAPERRSLLDGGLKDFREVVSDSDEHGEPSAPAPRSARGFPAMPPPSHDFDRIDTRDRGSDSPSLPEYAAPAMLEQGHDYDDPRPAARGAAIERGRSPGRGLGGILKIMANVVVLAALGALLGWQWPNITSLYRSVRAPHAELAGAPQPPAQSPSGPRKITERLESDTRPPNEQATPAAAAAPSAIPTAPAAAVAQKVVLYEEDPNDPNGKQYVGSAIWRTEQVSPGPGQPPEIAIRADVEIPDRKLAMTWSLRRNTDQSLPASHTVEIMFRLPQDFSSGGISNVPGILMKASEQTRGVPLAGLAVKVTNGFFLIGLSNTEGDRERNVQMLKERQWFDIPVVYANNRRAILAVEKGTPGERVFAEAFAAWRQ